ncbi:uncharacterized protein [Watersipora subatra]|uniref:uncharacterized protein n=1 Tax=Watersipora subatra TaxID=2589382 RepID=UPI00355C094B
MSIQEAEKIVIKLLQREYYRDELKALESSQSVHKQSSLLCLTPFLDKQGMMRIGGRTRRSLGLSFEEKHPLILPEKAHVSKLLIERAHQKVYHQGQAMTLGALRTQGYWITAANKLVKRHFHPCAPCRAMRAPIVHQQIGELPQSRLFMLAMSSHPRKIPKLSPCRSQLQQSTSPVSPKLTLGTKVIISGQKEGVLRYYGLTQFADSIWCGVELFDGSGKNDGAVQGVRYFSCPDNHGVFVSPHKLTVVGSDDNYESFDASDLSAYSTLSPRSYHKTPNLYRSTKLHPGDTDDLKSPSEREFGDSLEYLRSGSSTHEPFDKPLDDHSMGAHGNANETFDVSDGSKLCDSIGDSFRVEKDSRSETSQCTPAHANTVELDRQQIARSSLDGSTSLSFNRSSDSRFDNSNSLLALSEVDASFGVEAAAAPTPNRTQTHISAQDSLRTAVDLPCLTPSLEAGSAAAAFSSEPSAHSGEGKSIFEDVKAKAGESASEETFSASHGWLSRFNKRANLHNVSVSGEAASADKEAAKRFSQVIRLSRSSMSTKRIFFGRKCQRRPTLAMRRSRCSEIKRLKTA